MIGKRVVLIIQARMGSTRLPGKSMMDLAGEPLVGRILERVLRCRSLHEIVLAIPDGEKDAPLAVLGQRYGVTVYAGAENDLVERYYQAAKASRADIVGRLPADNAAPEPAEIDRIVGHHIALNRPGFSSNLAQVFDSGYPDGIGAEVFDFSLLSEIRTQTLSSRQREHVHLNFFDYSTQTAVNPRWCPVATIECPREFRRPDLVLDVNTEVQYKFMQQLYEYLYPINSEFHITDIVRWYDDVYRKSGKETSDLHM